MKISILHISDLHRDAENLMSNRVLLNSLELDRDQYTLRGDPCIEAPNLIIVSGDIIQGVEPNDTDAEAILRKQYDEALSFLEDLTDCFVEGDKQRIILVPGNHDISAYHFHKSLESINVVDSNKKALAVELFKKHSKLRWSWSDFSLHRIADKNMYDQRFAAFVDFYNRFYEGKHSYSIESENQFGVFFLSDFGVAVTGFCSCYNNDLMNQQGEINPDCIASAESQIRHSLGFQECLRLAVWHHNTEGLPDEINYMNSDIVQSLINGGFSFGFHGHQHKPQFRDIRFQHGSERRIIIISAGTLCGDAAFRHKRSYNIVELNILEGAGRLHVREMSNDNLSAPIWGMGTIPPSQSKYLDFKFDPPPQLFSKTGYDTISLSKAEKLYEHGEYRAAADILATLTDDLARSLLLYCLTELGDTEKIITFFNPPKNSVETIALLDALWEQKDKQCIRKVLELPFITESADLSIIEIRNKYIARLKNDKIK